jgi:hypothetical protein
MANIFREDMFENEPQSKAWVSFGKDGLVPKMGRITRRFRRMGQGSDRQALVSAQNRHPDANRASD